MDLIVMQLGPERFRVLVDDRGQRREYVVTLPQHARQGLGLARTPPAAIVEETFRFLLERTDPSGIAEEFVLPTVAGTYPEYPEEIRMRLG